MESNDTDQEAEERASDEGMPEPPDPDILRGKMMNRKTIGRNVTEGNDSGRFYPPLDVSVIGRRIAVFEQHRSEGIELWPDEARRLGLALIEAAVVAERQNQ